MPSEFLTMTNWSKDIMEKFQQLKKK